jgi:hypothetical protein
MDSIEMDSHGLSGIGRGVYMPYFLVVRFGNSTRSARHDILADLLSRFQQVEMFL